MTQLYLCRVSDGEQKPKYWAYVQSLDAQNTSPKQMFSCVCQILIEKPRANVSKYVFISS